jgi:peptidoglycan/xylan/chitin deacetylase (PgdA/CDA1 family)
MEKIGNFYFHGNRDKNKIALTFDDGPSEETKKVLDILKRYNAKATFFIWGQRIKGREKIIKRILKEGHEIGNHSFSHKWLRFRSKKFIKKDIEKCDKELNKFNVNTNLFRFPAFKFGINSIMVCSKLKKKVIFCDVISFDWLNPWLKVRFKRKSPVKIGKVIKKVLVKTKKGSIINFHDYLEGIGSHKEIIPILKEVMLNLSKRRYEFVTVSKLLNFKIS